jgi:hypothetical protein
MDRIRTPPTLEEALVETHTERRRPWLATLDEAGWPELVDRVLHGLCHDLTGRVSAILGLTYLLESSGGDPSPVAPLMNPELEGMEEVIRFLRLLPDDATEPELLAPGELLPELAALVRAQRGLENVKITVEGVAEAPAVRVDRTLLIRSLLILLTASAESTVLTGAKGVELIASGPAGCFTFELHPLPGQGGDGPDSEEGGLLPIRLFPKKRVQICLGVLVEEGMEVLELGDEGGAGGVQVAFPSPSPGSS